MTMTKIDTAQIFQRSQENTSIARAWTTRDGSA